MSISPIAVRLTRGTDLKQALHKLVAEHQIQAGSIASCVGCLSQISMRLAGAEHTLKRSEPFEIVSLMGTLTPEHQHVHISVADSKGNVLGGHLLEESIVDTTAELIVHHYPDLVFEREIDKTTGYTELHVISKD
ncbi:PPC domain-containing DNA-binding protein [Vibrio barjaei]|uniref:PPC domain-containing DNA-binding protein n=1 Tax=Vibrio barjaei TaxID=1676683 RepID=UPI0022851EBC|nr:PPC domain-containing DNA-binding protein [Vibrio barjaei]MCY9873796.1 DNA-binding protein [Vibrio barjaei]